MYTRPGHLTVKAYYNVRRPAADNIIVLWQAHPRKRPPARRSTPRDAVIDFLAAGRCCRGDAHIASELRAVRTVTAPITQCLPPTTTGPKLATVGAAA